MIELVGEPDAQLWVIFYEEALDHLNRIDEDVERLMVESARKSSSMSVMHAFHTLKGAARSVGCRDLELLCRELENTFLVICQVDLPFAIDEVDLIRQAAVIARQLTGHSTVRIRTQSLHLIGRLTELTRRVVAEKMRAEE